VDSPPAYVKRDRPDQGNKRVQICWRAEDIYALFISDPDGPSIGQTFYLSTRGNFGVSGLAGANEDGFVLDAVSLGEDTAGNYRPDLALDGSQFRLAAFNVDAIDLGPVPAPVGSAKAAPARNGPSSSPELASLLPLLTERRLWRKG